MKISRVKSRFLFWLRGYVVVPNFLKSDDSIEIRKYVESVNWSSENLELPHGSLCSFSNGEVFDFQKCRFDKQIQMSLEILNRITNERFSDVGVRTI